MIALYYQAALTGSDTLYLEAEQWLLQAGAEAATFLRQVQQQELSPPAQLLIPALLQRLAGNENYQRVLDFLERTEAETAPTVKGGPTPEWLGSKLRQDFGSPVAPLLGLHLVKLESVWPYWKTAGVILYLGKLDGRSAAPALLELVVGSPSDQYRKLAVGALAAIGDPAVLAALEARLAFIEQPRQRLLQVREAVQAQTLAPK